MSRVVRLAPRTTSPAGDSSVDDATWMQWKAELFQEGGNPLHAVECFLLARRCGFVPPDSVLRWLEIAFTQWHNQQGLGESKPGHRRKPKSIDQFLGLANKVGGTPLFELRAIEARDDMLMIDMVRLVEHFQMSTADAAAAIEARLEDTKGWNRSGQNIKAVKADYLMKKYSTWWSGWLGQVSDHQEKKDKRAAFVKQCTQGLSNEYLSKFPKHTLPVQLQQYGSAADQATG